MNYRLHFLLAALTATLGQAQMHTRLLPETLAAFEKYVAAVEVRLPESLQDTRPLAWFASKPEDVKKARNGEVVLHTFTGKDGYEVHDGLVHDWVGGAFFPGATVDRVVETLKDFDRHSQWYSEVIQSKLLDRNGDSTRGRWLLKREKVITIVLNVELSSTYKQVAPNHWFVRSATTQIREVRDYGEPDQSEYPAGEGQGFLWTFRSYWDLQRGDGGVYAGLRVISLSRGVPSGLGWIVNPFIRGMPMESLTNTLRNTREALRKGGVR